MAKPRQASTTHARMVQAPPKRGKLFACKCRRHLLELALVLCQVKVSIGLRRNALCLRCFGRRRAASQVERPGSESRSAASQPPPSRPGQRCKHPGLPRRPVRSELSHNWPELSCRRALRSHSGCLSIGGACRPRNCVTRGKITACTGEGDLGDILCRGSSPSIKTTIRLRIVSLAGWNFLAAGQIALALVV